MAEKQTQMQLNLTRAHIKGQVEFKPYHDAASTQCRFSYEIKRGGKFYALEAGMPN